MSGFWTPETIARVSALWAEGPSAGAIAEAFDQAVTRNAVLGKLSRLGLLSGQRKTLISMRRAASLREPVVLTPEPEAIGPLNDFSEPGICRFIHGEVGTEWRCCAQPVKDEDSSYCTHHYSRVWLPARRRPKLEHELADIARMERRSGTSRVFR
jgi:hypothetical protein